MTGPQIVQVSLEDADRSVEVPKSNPNTLQLPAKARGVTTTWGPIVIGGGATCHCDPRKMALLNGPHLATAGLPVGVAYTDISKVSTTSFTSPLNQKVDVVTNPQDTRLPTAYRQCCAVL